MLLPPGGSMKLLAEGFCSISARNEIKSILTCTFWTHAWSLLLTRLPDVSASSARLAPALLLTPHLHRSPLSLWISSSVPDRTLLRLSCPALLRRLVPARHPGLSRSEMAAVYSRQPWPLLTEMSGPLCARAPDVVLRLVCNRAPRFWF